MKLSDVLTQGGFETVRTMKAKVLQLQQGIEPQGMLLSFNEQRYFLTPQALDLLIELLHAFFAEACDRVDMIEDAIDSAPDVTNSQGNFLQ